MENYHPAIKEKLDFFLKTEKIPNIIFHGPSGSGKRTLVHGFVTDIYRQNKELMKSYVMNINCAHGKGIKFVREDLKFFAKTHINIQGSGHFKTVILSNADDLTTDAQSALRRCIELFSHSTRFFIIVEDKYKLLKPILSRLCEIYVSEPIVEGKRCNLYKHAIQHTFKLEHLEKKQQLWLRNTLNKIVGQLDKDKDKEKEDQESGAAAAFIMNLALKLYEKGYSGIDLMDYITHNTDLDEMHKYHLLIVFHNVKKEFRNEKMFLAFILNFLLLRSDLDLTNISFM